MAGINASSDASNSGRRLSPLNIEGYERAANRAFDHISGDDLTVDVDRAYLEEHDDGSMTFYELTGNNWFKNMFPCTGYKQHGYIIAPEAEMGENIYSVQEFVCNVSNSWIGSDEVEDCTFETSYSFTTDCGSENDKCSTDSMRSVFAEGECTSSANMRIAHGIIPILDLISAKIALSANFYGRDIINEYINKMKSIANCYTPPPRPYPTRG